MPLNQYKIISVVGARPQFIKLAGLQRAVEKESRIKHIIVHSGQHYDHALSGQFFSELGIPEPDYNIGIGSGSHNNQLAKCIIGMDEILEKEHPSMVIVFGDTNTTSAAAIATVKRNIPLAHIEAGLREFDKSIPEEVNKLITDALADLYFTPTLTGVKNLKNQGINNDIFLTGDISLDLLYREHLDDQSILQEHDLQSKKYIFATCHRAANTDNSDYLYEILTSFIQAPYRIVLALHPRTQKAIEQFGFESLLASSNIICLSPPGFWITQTLIKNAAFVITDSGGVIKETYFYKVPGIIIDKQTEWVETVEEGWNIIAGPDKNRILNAINSFTIPERHSNCIGNGKAGEKIVNAIIKYLDAKK